jgi:hypothetical protein
VLKHRKAIDLMNALIRDTDAFYALRHPNPLQKGDVSS